MVQTASPERTRLLSSARILVAGVSTLLALGAIIYGLMPA